MRKIVPAAALLWVAASLALAGCAPSTPSRPSDPAGRGAIATPEFSGPWADEFVDSYRRATTGFEREALADGRISDSEFAEMEDRFATCLSDKGVSFAGFKAGGAFEFTPGPGMSADAANAITDDCSARSGLNTIGYLFFAQQRNPQHLDEATIMAACLVRKRAVPQGYSSSDYDRDSPGFAYPFTDRATGEKALEDCSLDPLGLLRAGAG